MASATQRRRTIKTSLDDFEARVIEQSANLAEEIGEMLVEYSKTMFNRPYTGRGFTDRTGDLRRSIRGDVSIVERAVIMKLSASMPYAKYVETMRSGEYAFLAPALEEMIPQIQALIERKMQVETLYKDTGKAGRSRIAELIQRGREAERAESL